MWPVAGIRNAAARSVVCGTRCVKGAILSRGSAVRSPSAQLLRDSSKALALPLLSRKDVANKQLGFRLAARALTTLADTPAGREAMGCRLQGLVHEMPAWTPPFFSSLVLSAAGTVNNTEEASASCSTSVVVLEVGGMKCGGCSAAVKRMLLQRPDVESAAVNLLTETAAIKFKWVPVVHLADAWSAAGSGSNRCCIWSSAPMATSKCSCALRTGTAGLMLVYNGML
jgi:copper chaperone CopZ